MICLQLLRRSCVYCGLYELVWVGSVSGAEMLLGEEGFQVARGEGGVNCAVASFQTVG